MDISELGKSLEDVKGLVKANTDSVDAKLKAIEARMEERVKAEFDKAQEAIKKEMNGKQFTLAGVEDDKRPFSFTEVIKGVTTGQWDEKSLAYEIFRNQPAIIKDMATSPNTAGGYIVPTQYIPTIIELIRANTVVVELGAQYLTGLSGSPVDIPRLDAGSTAYWVAENSAITPSDQTLGQVQMTPHELAALTKISGRLVMLANPSIEALVRDDIVQALSLALDLAALRGSGGSNQPRGIANTASIKTVALGVAGGTPSVDTLYNMLSELEQANTAKGKLGFAMHPRTINTLRQLKETGTGAYILQREPTDPLKGTLIGLPYKQTTQIPTNISKGGSTNCSEIYLGNWNDLVIGNWGALSILASRETSDAFAKNQLWLRVIQEVDIAVRHPESFCLCNDVRP